MYALTLSSYLDPWEIADSSLLQITCLYDMDIPRPDNFNETYLYEGKLPHPNYCI